MTLLLSILSFALGMGCTWLWSVRSVSREIPADAAQAMWAPADEPELYDQESDDYR